MNNYHDNILIRSAEEKKINYTVIPNLSNYIGNLKKHIPIIGERLELSKLNNYKYIKAKQRDISFEAINLIKGLIEARVYRKDDTIIYIGDSLTENGYEFYLKDNPLINRRHTSTSLFPISRLYEDHLYII